MMTVGRHINQRLSNIAIGDDPRTLINPLSEDLLAHAHANRRIDLQAAVAVDSLVRSIGHFLLSFKR